MTSPPSPKLSIVLTTFNGGSFIREQLASVAAQTLRPHELVVCDDGSTDDTLAIVADFERAAPFPVRLQRNPARLGYAENFLQGCSLAQGDLIAFCDQDDVWQPEKLARCAAAFVADETVLLAIHSATVVDRDLRPRGHCKPDFARSEHLAPRGCELEFSQPGFAMVFSAALVRAIDWRQRVRDFLKADRPLMAHDQWIVFLARSLGRVVHLRERLALYRQHGGNTCGAADAGPPPVPTLQPAANETAYRERAEASRNYGQYLLGLASRVPRDWSAKLRVSAGHYHSQSKIYSARAHLYERNRNFWERVGTCASLWRQRAYRSRRASGLGWRAAIKDTGALVFGEVNPLGLFR